MFRDLHKLVYVSRNEIAGDEEDVRVAIDEILETARVFNLRLNVTGALMFNAGCFAQVLEGEHRSVQELFERIQCDFRHSNVVVLDFAPIESRSFGRWSMAYVGENRAALEEFERIAVTTDFDPTQLCGQRIYDVLLQHLLESENPPGTDRAA